MQNNDVRKTRRISPAVSWGLLIGGLFFFVGGSIHPGDDPPGLSVKEHLGLLFSDAAWYPSHALLLAGMVLVAAALVVLAQRRTLAAAPRAQVVASIAAVTAVFSAVATLVHLVAASEAARIASGQSTPITDVQIVTETLSAPASGFSIAALAVIGGATRTLGNRLIAAFGVVGGVSYGLAGGTFLFTDQLNFLFPASSGMGLWAIGAGGWLVLRARTTSPAASVA